MAVSEDVKRQAMDAVSHRETAAQVGCLTGGGRTAPAKTEVVRSVAIAPQMPGLIPLEVKRQAMDAIASVETIAQIGWLKMTGGIALYLARIREMDRGAAKQRKQRHPWTGRHGVNRQLGRE